MALEYKDCQRERIIMAQQGVLQGNPPWNRTVRNFPLSNQMNARDYIAGRGQGVARHADAGVLTEGYQGEGFREAGVHRPYQGHLLTHGAPSLSMAWYQRGALVVARMLDVFTERDLVTLAVMRAEYTDKARVTVIIIRANEYAARNYVPTIPLPFATTRGDTYEITMQRFAVAINNFADSETADGMAQNYDIRLARTIKSLFDKMEEFNRRCLKLQAPFAHIVKEKQEIAAGLMDRNDQVKKTEMMLSHMFPLNGPNGLSHIYMMCMSVFTANSVSVPTGGTVRIIVPEQGLRGTLSMGPSLMPGKKETENMFDKREVTSINLSVDDHPIATQDIELRAMGYSIAGLPAVVFPYTPIFINGISEWVNNTNIGEYYHLFSWRSKYTMAGERDIEILDVNSYGDHRSFVRYADAVVNSTLFDPNGAISRVYKFDQNGPPEFRNIKGFGAPPPAGGGAARAAPVNLSPEIRQYLTINLPNDAEIPALVAALNMGPQIAAVAGAGAVAAATKDQFINALANVACTPEFIRNAETMNLFLPFDILLFRTMEIASMPAFVATENVGTIYVGRMMAVNDTSPAAQFYYGELSLITGAIVSSPDSILQIPHAYGRLLRGGGTDFMPKSEFSPRLSMAKNKNLFALYHGTLCTPLHEPAAKRMLKLPQTIDIGNNDFINTHGLNNEFRTNPQNLQYSTRDTRPYKYMQGGQKNRLYNTNTSSLMFEEPAIKSVVLHGITPDTASLFTHA